MSFSYTYTFTPGTTGASAQVNQNFNDIGAYADTIAAASGANSSGVLRRGKSIIAGPETLVAPAAYAFAGTPDRVQNVVLPADGLIVVAYQALWQESVAGAARAAIFLGANQLVTRNAVVGVNALNEEEARLNGVANTDYALFSTPVGLASLTTSVGAAADVTTGTAIGGMAADSAGSAVKLGFAGSTPTFAGPAMFGGLCLIDAAAGTYDIGVKFKASSGNVTVKNRKLRVWVMGF